MAHSRAGMHLLDVEENSSPVLRCLSMSVMLQGKDLDIEQLHLDEPVFRMMHNEDAMATEKLAEGDCNYLF